VLDFLASSLRAVAFLAGGDGDRKPHETGVIGDGLVIAATRFSAAPAATELARTFLCFVQKMTLRRPVRCT